MMSTHIQEVTNVAKKKTENTELPAYSRVKRRDNYYLRARIYDADGKRIDIYGKDEQELTAKVLSAQREIEKTKQRWLDLIPRLKNTVRNGWRCRPQASVRVHSRAIHWQ